MSNNATSPNQNNFNNLIVRGIGFLNRVRVVSGGKKSAEYLSMTINALRGDSGDKTRFEVRVSGNKAKELVTKLMEEFPDISHEDFAQRPTLFAGFNIGDIQPMSFEAKQKSGKTTTVHYIDGRLLKFHFINVNKTQWYKANQTADDEAEAADDGAEEEAQATTEQPVAQAA
ncbi:MAG: DUF3577 domain-containing protein [Neisseriaceae bacterium]|nr:DUF3577 domain-containing protein [Neisseriaceae bacterium]